MGTRHRPTTLERHRRLKRIHKLLVLGLRIPEIASRLKVNERTIRRDIQSDFEHLEQTGQDEIAANRAAIMAELGRTYAEAVKGYKQAKATDRETFGYINSRIRALGLMARITGAEVPARMIIQGQIGIKHQLEPAVQMVSQAELLKMAQIAAEVAAQAPGFRGNISGNGHGNGDGSGNGDQ